MSELVKVWDEKGEMFEVTSLNARDLVTHKGFHRTQPVVIERKNDAGKVEKVAEPAPSKEDEFDPLEANLEQIESFTREQCMQVADALFETKLPKNMNKAEMQAKLAQLRDDEKAALEAAAAAGEAGDDENDED